jgi:hypothetical protein
VWIPYNAIELHKFCLIHRCHTSEVTDTIQVKLWLSHWTGLSLIPNLAKSERDRDWRRTCILCVAIKSERGIKKKRPIGTSTQGIVFKKKQHEHHQGVWGDSNPGRLGAHPQPLPTGLWPVLCWSAARLPPRAPPSYHTMGTHLPGPSMATSVDWNREASEDGAACCWARKTSRREGVPVVHLRCTAAAVPGWRQE